MNHRRSRMPTGNLYLPPVHDPVCAHHVSCVLAAQNEAVGVIRSGKNWGNSVITTDFLLYAVEYIYELYIYIYLIKLFTYVWGLLWRTHKDNNYTEYSTLFFKEERNIWRIYQMNNTRRSGRMNWGTGRNEAKIKEVRWKKWKKGRKDGHREGEKFTEEKQLKKLNGVWTQRWQEKQRWKTSPEVR